ncbi:signal transduction histidine-protein kinase/phosphatase DegS [mine drainage metagenome]|uniref:histidine kinase n=1 Tax=mine drainage metagenome TaxID=410659 RepID=A0A1J5RYV9_9ZZZZ
MKNNFRFSKLFLNQFIENFSEILYCFSVSENKMIYLSEGCKEITGYNAEELTNNPALDFYDLVHPEDKAKQINNQGVSFRANDFYKNEYRIVNKWGGVRWVQETSCLTKDEKQNEIIEGYIIDITEKKAHQEVIELLQAYQRSVNEGSTVSITDLKGKIIYVNDKFCEVSKYSKKELIGNTHRIISSGYHDKHFYSDLWRTITSGKPWRGEIKNKAKDGTYYWLDTVITPIFNSHHQIHQYLSVRNVITKQKEQEEELRISEERYRDIVQNTSDLIQSVTPDGRILFVNDTWLSKLGYTEENVIGQNIFLFIHPKSKETCKLILEGLINNQTFPTTEISFITKACKELICEGNINAIYNNNKMLHSTSMLRDITEIKRNRNELAEKRNLLLNAEKIAKAGSWCFDFKNERAVWSKGFYNIFGIKEGTFITFEKLISCIYDDDKDFVSGSWDDVLKGKKHNIEFRIKGEQPEKWVRSIVKIEFDHLNNPLTATGFIQDIMESKNSLKKLERKQQQLKSAQKIAHMGSWLLDIVKDELEWSTEMYHIFEIPLGTPMNLTAFRNMVHPKDKQLVADAWNTALAGKEYDIEHRIIVNGQEKWVREKAKVEFNDVNRQPLTGIGIVQDITKLKLLEKTLFNSIIETEEKERERISAELHDGVCQQLSGAVMLLKIGIKSLEAKDEKGFTLLKDCGEILHDSVNTIRNVSHQLTPKSFKEESLVEALRNLLLEFSRTDKSTQYTFHSADNVKEPESHIAINIYRVVQEFVNNSQKHSEAKKIELNLFFEDATFLIAIKDNGKGFDISRTNTTGGGIGILNMIKRIESIGGKHKLETAVSKGVTLTIRIPYSI